MIDDSAGGSDKRDAKIAEKQNIEWNHSRDREEHSDKRGEYHEIHNARLAKLVIVAPTCCGAAGHFSHFGFLDSA
jgi:hypothetical protein